MQNKINNINVPRPSKTFRIIKAPKPFTRADGSKIKNLTPMQRVMPFLFKTRTESLIYSPESVDFTKAREYIKNKNKELPGLNLGTFHLIIAALLRTIAEYPYLNRFICGKRLYARNYISFSFVVLQNIQNGIDETNAKVFLSPEDTIVQVVEKVNDTISYCRYNGAKEDDKLMDFVAKLPNPVISLIVFFLRKLNDWALLPKSYIDTDPLFTSVFISNLGSIGHGALNHHLYEWGTASIFLTMGRLTKEATDSSDSENNSKWTLDLKLTADERIAYGYYLVKAMKHFQHLIRHPELLEKAPGRVVVDDGVERAEKRE
ncbi:hypothetical protein ACPWSR_01105 [Alloiococcus sp. CFN-8]|uniref:hypothetical protein n=1 Tax=Alloiococcus sp. CFN-8 TaxID=3416081 RepID=UPI003CEA7E51